MNKFRLLFFIAIVVVLLQKNLLPSVAQATNMSVSGLVPAQPSDFVSTLTRLTTGNDFSQNSAIQYKITYGSHLSYAIDKIVVKAKWEEGTITGGSTVDILSYVAGSASNAYNNTLPVIDTVNRTITWTITNFPASTTNQTVTFSLKTNSAYAGNQQVTFRVGANVAGPGTQTADSTDVITYLYSANLNPTPTPTLAATPTSAPEPTNSSSTSTPTPTSLTPTPTVAAETTTLLFSGVSVNTISQDTATIGVLTSQPTTLTISYGPSSGNLTNRIAATSLTPYHDVSFSGLTSSTTYYVRVNAANSQGDVISSDFYTFKTAIASEAPRANPATVVLTSNNIILRDTSSPLPKNQLPITTLPVGTYYEFQMVLQNYEQIKQVSTVLRNKNVLGLSSFIEKAYASSAMTDMIEVRPGVFTGRLITPQNPGSYEIITRISDINGNIVEQPVATVVVIKKLTVVESGSNTPIENARVLFLFKQLKTKKYGIISPEILPIKNPISSDLNGEVNIVLPTGSYEAQISALGYTDKIAYFTVGTGKNDVFPTVRMKKEPFNLLSYTTYTLGTFSDVLESTRLFLFSLGTSFRFFNLLGVICLMFLVFLSFLSFSLRAQVDLFHTFKHSLFSFIHYLRGDHKRYKLDIRVVDKKTNASLGRVNVVAFDMKSKMTVAQTFTDATGRASFNLPDSTYDILLSKVSYNEENYTLILDETRENVLLTLSADENPLRLSSNIVLILLEQILIMSFEGLLIGAVLIEIVLVSTFGFLRVLPFFLLSLVNILLWISFLRKSRK